MLTLVIRHPRTDMSDIYAHDRTPGAQASFIARRGGAARCTQADELHISTHAHGCVWCAWGAGTHQRISSSPCCPGKSFDTSSPRILARPPCTGTGRPMHARQRSARHTRQSETLTWHCARPTRDYVSMRVCADIYTSACTRACAQMRARACAFACAHASVTEKEQGDET